MRILQVLPSLGAGGAERMVLHLSAWLKDAGQEVEVAYLNPIHTMRVEFEEKGVSTCYLKTLPFISRWYPRDLVRYLVELRPDVVHCHGVVWRKAGMACRNTRTPCILTLHGYYADWIDRGRGWMIKLIPHTNYIVGVSEQVVRLVRERLSVCEDKLLFIPNGIPDIADQAEEKDVAVLHELNLGHVIGTVARLEPPKDFNTLLEAVAIAKRHIDDISLFIAGDGSLRAAIEEQARQLGILDRVFLLGYVSNVASFLKRIDVFVLSSLSEGMPISVLEAMCMERPIVATDVGSNSMMLDNGRCGLLVQPNDPHAMAVAIVELLTNPNRAQQLAYNARSRYVEEFTVEAMAARYLKLYKLATEG